MTRRKPPARPVEIVLSEEDLASILRETVGTRITEAPRTPPREGFGGPAAVDPAWHLGAGGPGAVGDAIRMILEATTLDRGKRAT